MSDDKKPSKKLWIGALAPLAVGTVIAGIFFAAVTETTTADHYLYRYTMGHPVNMTEVWLFFWGLAEVAFRFGRLRRERRAAHFEWLPPAGRAQPTDAAAALINRIDDAPVRFRRSLIAKRLRTVLHFVHERGSAEGLDDYLRHQSQLDADEAQAGYSLVRLIAWMIPILGFLGTVLGITIAIAYVSPTELETSLDKVTGGLAVAFDTTGVALILSMMLMFSIFLCEKAEGRVLSAIDDHVERELAHRFVLPLPTIPGLPGIEQAIERTSLLAIQSAQELVERQSNLWAKSIAAIEGQAQSAWSRLAQEHLDASARAEAARRQAEARSREELGEILARHDQQAIQAEAARQQAESRLREELRDALVRQDQHFARSLEALQARWTEQANAVVASNDRLAAVERNLERIANALVEIIDGERILSRTQDRLTENLAVLQQSRSLDEAIHSLTAAVHLMTIRHQPPGLGERKSA